MKVILKSDLFTPIGRFKKTEFAKYPSELPDEVRPHLPKTAIIVEGEKDPLPVPKRPLIKENPEEEDVSQPVTMTEMHKASKGVSALEHYSKKK